MPLAYACPRPFYALLLLFSSEFFRLRKLSLHLLELAKFVAKDASPDQRIKLTNMELLDREKLCIHFLHVVFHKVFEEFDLFFKAILLCVSKVFLYVF